MTTATSSVPQKSPAISPNRNALNGRFMKAKSVGVTLESIGDGVVATDASAVVTFVNPVAADLLGMPAAEIMGRRLADVFTIVNEYTRQAVDNPVERVI